MLAVVFSPSANSVYKGESALGDQKVLTLASSKSARNQFCSMSMLTERIVVTAGHCMAAEASAGGKLRFDTEQIWVTQPGADMASDDLATRGKVSKVVLIPGYENYWDPTKNDRRTQRDDIAFIFLDSPLSAGYTIPIATAVEVSQLKNSGALITHFGYGLQEQNKVDQKPYKLSLKVLPNADPYLDAGKTIFTLEDGRALCPGDSGGPWYADFNGVTKIVAVTVAAGGCRGSLDPRGWTLGTLIHPTWIL
jgi:secreted trypsin-like serine protease